MPRVHLLAALVLTACATSPPPPVQEPVRARSEVPDARESPAQDHLAVGGGGAASPVAGGSQPAPPRRLRFEGEGCALVDEESAVVAPPCVLDASSHDLTCLLPDAAMPHFLPLDPRRDAPPPGFTLSLAGPFRDVAASSAQVCTLDGDGAVACRRPGAAPRAIPELPPMTTITLGAGCGDILCGVSETGELVCVATATRAGSVRVPDVAAVSVDGCTVCMAAADGRLACFGAAGDGAPFLTPPRVIVGVACSAR